MKYVTVSPGKLLATLGRKFLPPLQSIRDPVTWTLKITQLAQASNF